MKKILLLICLASYLLVNSQTGVNPALKFKEQTTKYNWGSGTFIFYNDSLWWNNGHTFIPLGRLSDTSNFAHTLQGIDTTNIKTWINSLINDSLGNYMDSTETIDSINSITNSVLGDSSFLPRLEFNDSLTSQLEDTIYIDDLIVKNNININTDSNRIENLRIKGNQGFYPKNQKAFVTFTFDDAHVSDDSLMRPLFTSKGVVASSAITTNWVGTYYGGYTRLEWREIDSLKNAGWEIMSHTLTHTPLRSISIDSIDSELRRSKDTLVAHGFEVRNLSYPYHDQDTRVREVARRYYHSARGANRYLGGTDYTFAINPHILNSYRLNCYPADNHLLTPTNKVYVDSAYSQKKWLIFYLHQTTQIDVDSVGSLIDYILLKGISIVTPQQALDSIGNYVDYGDNIAIGEFGLRTNEIWAGPDTANNSPGKIKIHSFTNFEDTVIIKEDTVIGTTEQGYILTDSNFVNTKIDLAKDSLRNELSDSTQQLLDSIIQHRNEINNIIDTNNVQTGIINGLVGDTGNYFRNIDTVAFAASILDRANDQIADSNLWAKTAGTIQSKITTDSLLLGTVKHKKLTTDGSGWMDTLFLDSGDTLTGAKLDSLWVLINNMWRRIGTKVCYTGGNVGIGTLAPTAKLEVATTGAVGIELDNTAGSSTASSLIQFKGGGVNTWGFGQAVLNTGHHFDIYDYTNSRVSLTVDNTGYLGIGSWNTGVPALNLHINYTDATTTAGSMKGILLTNTNATANTGPAIRFGGSITDVTGTIDIEGIHSDKTTDSEDGYVRFIIPKAGTKYTTLYSDVDSPLIANIAGIQKMKLSSTGLKIWQGSAGTYGGYVFIPISDQYPQINFYKANGKFAQFLTAANDSGVYWDAKGNQRFSTGGVDGGRTIIITLKNSNKSVGIGTENPTEKLEVDGDIKATDNADSIFIGTNYFTGEVDGFKTVSQITTTDTVKGSNLKSTGNISINDTIFLGNNNQDTITAAGQFLLKDSATIDINGVNYVKAKTDSVFVKKVLNVTENIVSESNIIGNDIEANNLIKLDGKRIFSIEEISSIDVNAYGDFNNIDLIFDTTKCLGKISISDLTTVGTIPILATAGGILGVAASDKSLKENIKPMPAALTKIKKLKPITFNFIADSTKTKKIGLIAQDVKKVVPEVIYTFKGVDNNELMGIRYDELTTLLIKGMQEQQIQIDSLKKQNIELQKQINSLKK